jgi:zinc transport system ATP-binding protein
MPVMIEAAISFENVSVAIGGVRILESVNARVPRGSATAIIGPNGAGKTTLLLATLGQLAFDGRIRIPDTRRGPARVGYVPQRLDFDRGMPMTVMDLMVMGTQRRPLFVGRSRRRQDSAMALLQSVKADPLADRRLGALSGGELQRVPLALAIQRDPDILVLDEPSSGSTSPGEPPLRASGCAPGRSRFTQVMVTHDLSLVTAHATDVICLNRRVMGQGPTQSTLTAAVLAATFGIHLGVADLHPLPGCAHDEHGHQPHTHA